MNMVTSIDYFGNLITYDMSPGKVIRWLNNGSRKDVYLAFYSENLPSFANDVWPKSSLSGYLSGKNLGGWYNNAESLMGMQNGGCALMILLNNIRGNMVDTNGHPFAYTNCYLYTSTSFGRLPILNPIGVKETFGVEPNQCFRDLD